jgi:hypothetical protein
MKPDPKFGYHFLWMYPICLILLPYFYAHNFLRKMYYRYKYRHASQEVRRRYLGDK